MRVTRVNWRAFTLPAAIALGIALSALQAEAATNCIDGVNCYCDRVRPGGDLADPNLIFCEDFEAVTLHDDSSVGGVAPLFGPWYDKGYYRGENSYWQRTYGSGVSDCAWRQGQPASPKVGVTCNANTCYQGEWRADDRWQANSFACLDIVQDGEFDDEISSNVSPSVPGKHSGVFDGKQSLAQRTAPGRLGGITGFAKFPGTYRTFGVTMAVGYPTNSARANLWDDPWKHNEWETASEGKMDGIFLFHNTGGLQEDDPFQMFMFHANGSSQSQCETALAKASVVRGSVWCNDVALYYRADPLYYKRSRDFPFGTWGCAQGYFKDLGASNSIIKIWFNNTLIIHIENLDTRSFSARSGYKSLVWNNYANRNQTSNLSTESTYRYEDNIHVTAGAPASCAQVGFSGSTPPPATSDPLSSPGQPTVVN